jgi:uncharacterized protein YbjT (DUF2867 family)
MILVTGATGKVGGHVVTRLLRQGHAVRALSRDPSSANLPTAVDVARGQPGDGAAMSAALRGVTEMFVVLVGDVESQVRQLAAAARSAPDLRRVVLLSSSSVLHPIRHPIAAEHRAAEQVLCEAAPEWTLLRPGPFHSNALWWSKSIRDTGVARCLVGNRAGAPIDPDDVAAVAVTALTEDGHHGQAYELTGGQVLTSGDQVRIIAAATGRKLDFEVASEEEAVAAFTAISGDRAVAVANVAALRSALVPWARPAGTVSQLLGRSPRTFRAWATENAAAFR